MATSPRRFIAGLTASTRPVQLLIPNPVVTMSIIRRNQISGLPLIVLRSSRKYRPWIIEASFWNRFGGGGVGGGGNKAEIKKTGVCGYAIGDKGNGGQAAEIRNTGERDRTVEVVVAAVATAALGVGNRVMYKLALVPLKHYPFFLAQLSTFGYLAVYYSILFLRHRAGTITDEMLALPKAPFLAVGILEALAAAAGMAATANLSGASTTVLSQTFLIWQILFSIIFLGRRYSLTQLAGCTLVALGVIVSVASGSGATHSLKEAGIFWSLIMVLSFLLQGADTVLKEVIFLDSARRLKGGSLDLFVVNSYGSAYQAIFTALLLPFLSKLWGIPFNQLPSYLIDGAACFLNISTMTTGCEGAPLLPTLFVIVNLGYNICLLHLIKISSAVVSCLVSTVSVPIAVYCFTLPLPYLEVAWMLPRGFVGGTAILILGMLVYSWTPPPSNAPTSVFPSSPSS